MHRPTGHDARRELGRGAQATGATAVPYFAWANRGPGEMAVWLPLAD